MDNLLEIILPLAFFAVYFLSQLFGKKGGGESPEEIPDEMRKVREELKRKIEERRKAIQGHSQQQQRREDAQSRPAPEERAGGAVLRESRPRHEVRQEPAQPRRQLTPRTESAPMPDYDAHLQERMEEVRRSREEVEAAREKAREKVAALGIQKTEGTSAVVPLHGSAQSYRQFLRESLRDPANLQRSFLLHEVFGTPVGMRQNGAMRPSWEL